ncbi:MAG: type I DNA topoisomerase [Clostridia bacterium]|nr:type I DNA topoisomerase [Clostridia bacterium]
MANYLMIVESPAKAKTIKKYLGKNYHVSASMGHIRDLPKSKLGVDVDQDFEPNYITIYGKGDLLSKLKKEAKAADKVFLATDSDREGEAISWHLATALNLDEEKKGYRVTFNEITKTAVQNAIKNPREIDQSLVDAQQARRVLDRVVGYKISPLLWKKVRKGLSAGRVQSVATRLICDREDEIEAFVPQEYWELAAKLSNGKTRGTFEAKFHGKTSKMTVRSQAEMDAILAELQSASFVVETLKTGEKKKYAQPPFITSTLQQEASRKLGFNAKRTMDAAQQLYEGVSVEGRGQVGLITYMRTDSLRISQEALASARDYIAAHYGMNNLPSKPNVYRSKKSAQDAHEAIRPSDVTITPEMLKATATIKPDQYKLYKLIWERFVASQMVPAVYEVQTADIRAGQYLFKASGSKVVFAGYSAVYAEKKEDDEDLAKKLLPEMSVGQTLVLENLAPSQHFTQPPARYNEATFIRTLEELGIGRPSTYAPIVTTILNRGYVIRREKMLAPTELGRLVNNMMCEYFPDIVDVDFTAKMEDELDEVENGTLEWKSVLRKFYGPFADTLSKAESEIEKIKIEDEVTDVICEKCGRNMVVKIGKFGKFLACPGFPSCRNSKPIAVPAAGTCPLCGKALLVKKTRKNKKYFGCEDNPKCGFMTWDEPMNEACPTCGKTLLKKLSGKPRKIVCSNESCDYERPLKSTKKKEENE